MGDHVNVYLQIFLIAVAPNTSGEGETSFQLFPAQSLVSTSQTDIPTPVMLCPPASLPVSVAVAAYCLNPAGRPGALALQMPTVLANRPVLLVLHHSHLQSSRRT